MQGNLNLQGTLSANEADPHKGPVFVSFIFSFSLFRN